MKRIKWWKSLFCMTKLFFNPFVLLWFYQLRDEWFFFSFIYRKELFVAQLKFYGYLGNRILILSDWISNHNQTNQISYGNSNHLSFKSPFIRFQVCLILAAFLFFSLNCIKNQIFLMIFLCILVEWKVGKGALILPCRKFQ